MSLNLKVELNIKTLSKLYFLISEARFKEPIKPECLPCFVRSFLSRSIILLIANAKVTVVNDTTSLIAAETVTATTSGVTTTTTDPGIYSTVY